jgi:hypothetical protein
VKQNKSGGQTLPVGSVILTSVYKKKEKGYVHNGYFENLIINF